VVFLDEETERERPCLVALAMYGFSAFSRAARFLALKSMVQDSPFKLKATGFAFADPSKSSVTVTVVWVAITAILTPQAVCCLIPHALIPPHPVQVAVVLPTA